MMDKKGAVTIICNSWYSSEVIDPISAQCGLVKVACGDVCVWQRPIDMSFVLSDYYDDMFSCIKEAAHRDGDCSDSEPEPFNDYSSFILHSHLDWYFSKRYGLYAAPDREIMLVPLFIEKDEQDFRNEVREKLRGVDAMLTARGTGEGR